MEVAGVLVGRPWVCCLPIESPVERSVFVVCPENIENVVCLIVMACFTNFT